MDAEQSPDPPTSEPRPLLPLSSPATLTLVPVCHRHSIGVIYTTNKKVEGLSVMRVAIFSFVCLDALMGVCCIHLPGSIHERVCAPAESAFKLQAILVALHMLASVSP